MGLATKWASGACVLALISFGQAKAQAGSAPQAIDNNGDIIVTAQKRSESIQKVPLAITALSGEKLAQTGVANVQALANTIPSVNIAQQPQGIRVTIRGIGNDSIVVGEESPIAFNQDGVFIARTAAAAASLYDIDRIEVLRGPQGTLYGRNATGGAINVITRNPTEDFDGYLKMSGGTYGAYSGEGAIGGALTEGVRARIAFRTSNREGFHRNLATGNEIDDENARSVRGKIEFLPTSRLSILIGADYTWKSDRSGGWHYLGQFGAAQPGGVLLGGFVPPNYLNTANEVDPRQNIRAAGVNATITYDFDFAKLKSITAYRRTRSSQLQDLDATSYPLFSPTITQETGKQFSQELQLSGNVLDTDWLLGAYYFKENVHGSVSGRVWNGAYLSQGYYAGSALYTDAEAVFAQITHHFGEKFSITLGGRYNTERKTAVNQASFDLTTPETIPFFPYFNPAAGAECSRAVQTAPNCVPSERWSGFTPKFGIEYQMTPTVLLFASATKGFRSGNYPLGTPQPPVGPETIWAYEAGVKAKSVDGRWQANITGFYYDYSDLQVQKVSGVQTLTENAASAKIKGIEAELVAKPVTGLQFDLSGSYVDARFTQYISIDPARPAGDGVTTENGAPAFNLKDKLLPQAPKLNFLAGAQYRMALGKASLLTRVEATHSSRVYFTAFNVPELSVGSRNRLNAYMTYETGDKLWAFSIVGRNLTNRIKPTNAFVTTALVGYAIVGNIEDPRTVTFSVSRRF